MATLEEATHSALDGPDEDAFRDESHKTPERRHVDALLDISEEDFLKELDPYEYHCYSGLEEAVRGWARVAPMSCILLTQKRYRKPKPKEPDHQTPTSVYPTPSCESQNHVKKSMPLNHQVGHWSAVTALQPDTSKWPVPSATQKTMSHLLLQEKTKEEGTLRETPVQPHRLSSKYSVSENRPTKPQQASPRHNNTVVPIKNFTFLPPIKSPHLNPTARDQLCSGKKASRGETSEENSFMFDTSETRGTRVDPAVNTEPRNYSAALTSKYQTCQHNPHLFSAVSVSIPKRYKVPFSSKSDTVHHRRHSVGKSLQQALYTSSAAGAQAHMHPSCLFS